MIKALLAFFLFAVVAFCQSSGFGGGIGCVLQFSSLGIENCSTTLLSGLTIGPVVGPFQVANSSGYAGLVAEAGNTTVPTSLPLNSSGWLGPDSASFTSYFFQPSSTAPSATGPMLVGAVGSNVVPVSYGTVSGTGTVFPTTASPTFTGTVTVPTLDVTTLGNITVNNNASPGTFTEALQLYGTGPASSGNQIYSGGLHARGYGWNTTVPASQTVDMINFLAPVQGATVSSQWIWSFQQNGGGYNERMYLSSGGTLFLPSLGTAVGNDYVCLTTDGGLSLDTTCGTSLAAHKENITGWEHGLDYIMRMKPVAFDWKPEFHRSKTVVGLADVGMVADDIAAIDPVCGVYDKEGQLENFKDRAVLATAIKAIQELKQENDSLRSRIEALEARQ